jgi:hypothetical protein
MKLRITLEIQKLNLYFNYFSPSLTAVIEVITLTISIFVKKVKKDNEISMLIILLDIFFLNYMDII